jgi:proprotein convertase subtilisin/kexin type 5
VDRCPPGFYANDLRVCVTVCPDSTPQKYADATTNLCVLTCPNNYFAESVSKSCLGFCVAGKFADTNTKICESTCTATSPIEYSDPSTRKCVTQCPLLPLLYGQTSDKTCVVSCGVATEYAKDSTRTCVVAASCNPQFADPATKKCVSQCPFAYSRFADPSIWTCSPTCAGALNADPSTMTCVAQCPLVPRLFAHNNVCQADCLSTTLFADPVNRICSATCPFSSPNFYYRANTTRVCTELCPVNSYADNSSRYCVAVCPITTYADNSTWRCVRDCPSSPSLYADATSLSCVFLCPAGYFSDPTTRSCVQSCPLDPRYYRYAPLRICTQLCPFPYGKEDSSGNCVTECANGLYLNITQNKCVVCQVQCTTCSALLACTSCIPGYFLSLGACSVRCSAVPPLFADPVSQSCVAGCPSGYYGLDATRACVTACPVQFYGDSAQGLCVACPEGCVTCGGANCFTCLTGYIHSTQTLTCKRMCSPSSIFYYQDRCYSACPLGSYLLPDEVTCQTCGSECVTCSISARNCTLCLNAFLYNDRCVVTCPGNHFNNNGTCTPCSSNEAACRLPPLSYVVNPFF